MIADVRIYGWRVALLNAWFRFTRLPDRSAQVRRTWRRVER